MKYLLFDLISGEVYEGNDDFIRKTRVELCNKHKEKNNYIMQGRDFISTNNDDNYNIVAEYIRDIRKDFSSFKLENLVLDYLNLE